MLSSYVGEMPSKLLPSKRMKTSFRTKIQRATHAPQNMPSPGVPQPSTASVSGKKTSVVIPLNINTDTVGLTYKTAAQQDRKIRKSSVV